MNKQTGIILGLAALALAGVYFFGRRIIGAVTEFNKDTPYEGSGAVGALGNVADKVSGGTLSAVGSSLGATLYNWFGPKVPATDVYYSVTFPDGARHAIHAPLVDSFGFFTYAGVKYRMKDDVTGRHFAVRA